MSSETSPTKHHILLMEGDVRIQQTLTELLKDLFVIHTSRDFSVSLEILKNLPIAVLVADEQVTNGAADFLNEVARVSSATRVLLTGYDNVESVSRAVARGHIYAYFAKPWAPMELRLTLSQAAAHYDLVRRLEVEQQLLQQLMEHSPDIIYFKDAHRRFTRVNQAKAELVGVSDPALLIGKGDWDFFSPTEAARITQEDDRVIAEHQPVVDALHCFTPPDGRLRWFSTTKVPLDAEAGGGLVGISRDITERKLSHEQLQSMTRRLVESEKKKKSFYTQVVKAVTGGRLHLIDIEELPELEEVAFEYRLDGPEEYSQAREAFRELGLQGGFSEEQIEDLVLAAGEAITNAIKHAVDGVCQGSLGVDGITIRVSDRGRGIRSEDLPETLFRPGFSTQVSLGLGYTLLLELVDTIWLVTSPLGTTLQLLKRKAMVGGEEEELSALLERFATD